MSKPNENETVCERIRRQAKDQAEAEAERLKRAAALPNALSGRAGEDDELMRRCRAQS